LIYINTCSFNIHVFIQLTDLTIKKKKKKKTFDLDAALGEGYDESVEFAAAPDKENLEPSAGNDDFDGSFKFVILMCYFERLLR